MPKSEIGWYLTTETLTTEITVLLTRYLLVKVPDPAVRDLDD